MKAAHVLTLTLASSLMACAPAAPMRTPSAADVDPLRRAVVEDIVNGLSDVYEPSETVLIPARPMAGAFDTALMAALRASGFTVGTEAAGGRFDSHVDVLEGHVYRVTVTVDRTALSRLWVLDGANAYPGGSWAHRE